MSICPIQRIMALNSSVQQSLPHRLAFLSLLLLLINFLSHSNATPAPNSASQHIDDSDKTLCCGNTIAYTYDICTSQRPCAAPRHCVNYFHRTACGYTIDEPCRCEPVVMTPCAQAVDCESHPYEICAYLPNSPSYCYSQEVVTSNSSFNYKVGTCCNQKPSSAPSNQPKPSVIHPSLDPTTQPSSVPKPSEPKPSVYVPPPSTEPEYSPKASPTKFTITLVPKPSYAPSTYPYPSNGETPSPSPSREHGLTGDPCNTSKPCKGFRQCNKPSECSACDGQCIWSMLCTCTSDCPYGEICVSSTYDSTVRSCYSPFRVAGLDWINIHSCNDSGMTGDGCINDSNCQDGRECVQGGRSECLSGLIQCGLDRPKCGEDNIPPYDCYCSGFKTCDCENPCQNEAEVCCNTQYGSNVCISRKSIHTNVTQLRCDLTLDNNVTLLAPNDQQEYAIGDPLNLSNSDTSQVGSTESPAPSSSTSSSNSSTVVPTATVCIDAKVLVEAGVELVYSEHQRGSVLCDEHGSCATPGHMVKWNGEAMMMRRYCDFAECSRKVMWVNSIKYKRRGIIVHAKTNGLEFTALAARYESKFEEALLRSMVRLGF